MSGNRQILIESIPDGHLSADHFTTVDGDIPTPGPGEVLCKTILVSIDPANRAWLRMRTYRDQLQAGEVMSGFTLSEVVDANGTDLEVGTIVNGEAGWQEFAALPAESLPPAPPWRPLTNLMSVFGVTGMTAYFGLLETGRPEAGETMVISAAAGAVGSVAGQIARIKGCRVVGITGSEEKARLLVDELGFDAVVNRRSESFEEELRSACPDGFQLYFDNTAGPLLEIAIANLEPHGRVVCCGAAGIYDAADLTPPSNVPMTLTASQLRMEGFTVLDYLDRFGEAFTDLSQWVGDGRLKVVEEVVDGLENAPQALVGLLGGDNTGKRMVRVTADPA